MSQDNINHLLHLWGLSLMQHGAQFGPFDNYQHIFETIDSIEEGDAPWQCLKIRLVNCEDVDDSTPEWKSKEYELWYRCPDVVLANMLSNPDFDGQFDYQPYVETGEKDERRYSDFMSGNFGFRQAVSLLHLSLSCFCSFISCIDPDLRRRTEYTRLDICSADSGKRQNNRICWNR